MLRSGPDQRLPAVLIVDDDTVSREVMATILTMSGYTVHTAAHGAGALALLDEAQCAPDVVLMDIQMPGMRGADLIGQLRARTHARIYAMSGCDAPPPDRAGADGFLLKPLGPAELLRFLEQHSSDLDTLASPPAVVSPRILAQMRALMPESAVREIYQAVLSDLARRFGALNAAWTQRDATEVRRLGHAIKGGCGMAGALEAARIGEQLEYESDELGNTPALLGHLRSALESLQAMLEAEFPSFRNPHPPL